MNNKYARAYTEVTEIISHFSEEEYKKIPEEKIQFYKNNMDKNYKYHINPEIDLSLQDISVEANAILVSLFKEYFANDKQKEVLDKLLKQNQIKQEESKKEKYNIDNLFKKDIKEEKNKIQIIEYKENIFKRILNKLKKTFRLKI